MQLPKNLTLSQLLSKWSAILNPVIASPMSGVSILPNVNLVVGTNVINHRLGQTQQGWFLTDVEESLTSYPYRNAPFNNLTLSLHSPVACTVSIGVF